MSTTNTPQNTIIHPPLPAGGAAIGSYPAKPAKPAKKRNTGVGLTGWGAKSEVSFSMWLQLPIGCYAIAARWPESYDASKDPRDIMVRSRKRVYLDRLRKAFLPELGPDVGRDGKGTDYGHRAYVSSADLAKAMARMATRVDSPGFKDHAVDDDLHNTYMRMWSAMATLDDNSPLVGKGASKWGETGWWQKPADGHVPKPADCMRLGYHWFTSKTGNATCVDCGAQRTEVAGKGGKAQFRYTYPAGAVVLHTQNGKVLDKKQVRRIPGGSVPFDGGPGAKKAPAFPSPTTTNYGLGTLHAAPKHTDGDPAECLQFSDHWWTGTGTAVCKDCGAGRCFDTSGRFVYTQPAGSVMLTDSHGFDIDDPHVVTEGEAEELAEELSGENLPGQGIEVLVHD